MAFHVRDPKTDALVREVARRRRIGITEAIRDMAERTLADDSKNRDARSHAERVAELRERLRPLLEQVDAMPKTDVVLDKRFYDELWGQEDED